MSSIRRWIRRFRVCNERSSRKTDSFAIFIDEDGFCVLKRRGFSGFPRRGDERMMRWDDIAEIMEGQEGWIPSTTLYILDKHGFVAVINEDMRHWNAAIRQLVEHCPGFTEKALMRASLNTEYQVLLYPVETSEDAKESVSKSNH